MNHKLSLITINYNDKLGLQKTFDSVFSQTSNDFEYLVIDGNSNDGSVALIEENQDKISYYISEPDKGIYNAMNKGIKAAKGEYILFINSGDKLASNTVIEQVLPKLVESAIIYGKLIYSENNIQKSIFTPPNKLDLPFFVNHFLPHPASFIKKDLFDNVLYNENLRIVSDWEFFLKTIIVDKASYKFVDLTISDFDFSGVSSQKDNEQKIENEKKAVYKTLFNFSDTEVDLLKFASSKRMQQVKIIQKKKFLWKILKLKINILSLFTKKEAKLFQKITSK